MAAVISRVMFSFISSNVRGLLMNTLDLKKTPQKINQLALNLENVGWPDNIAIARNLYDSETFS